MPSKHKTALIKTVKDRHIRAIRRSRNKAVKLYQDWYVWTYGISIQYLANEYATKRTRDLWLKLYSERLHLNIITNVMMVQYYLADKQVDYSTSKELVALGVERGYIQPSWLSRDLYKRAFLDPMFQHHFLNNVEGKKAYVLTQRARLLLSTYERFLRDFIQPSRVPQ